MPTLSSTTALLSQWLAPRMGELRRLHPEIDLRLHASDAIVKLSAGGIEAAIRYGRGPFSDAAGVACIEQPWSHRSTSGTLTSPISGSSVAALRSS